MDSMDGFDDGANDARHTTTRTRSTRSTRVDARRRERGARFERREGVRREREGVGRRIREDPTGGEGARRETRRRARTMNAEKRAEIYTYEAPWMIYACNWSVRGERGDGLGTRAREN